MTGDQLTIGEAVEARNAILWLIAEDPRNSEHVKAVAAAIATHHQPGDRVSANDVRPFLPSWIRPQTIGPAFAVLRNRGGLEWVGWEPSTDRGTHGKPVNVYRVVGA